MCPIDEAELFSLCSVLINCPGHLMGCVVGSIRPRFCSFIQISVDAVVIDFETTLRLKVKETWPLALLSEGKLMHHHITKTCMYWAQFSHFFVCQGSTHLGQNVTCFPKKILWQFENNEVFGPNARGTVGAPIWATPISVPNSYVYTPKMKH